MAVESLGIPLIIIVPLFVWEMIWKGIALWRCGRNKQLLWFVMLFIVNTLGVLPIIYLKWFQEVPKKVITTHAKTPKTRKKK